MGGAEPGSHSPPGSLWCATTRSTRARARGEWLGWLANTTPDQRARWFMEPGGVAIYWEDLDKGIEAAHRLSMQPIV